MVPCRLASLPQHNAGPGIVSTVHSFVIADLGGLFCVCRRSQSPAVPCVCDPGHSHADGSHTSGQDPEEGMAPGPLQAPVFPSDGCGHTPVPRLQLQQHNLFLSCSVSDS